MTLTQFYAALARHGCGHPVERLSRNWREWMGVHGCDGCCTSVDFHKAEARHITAATQQRTVTHGIEDREQTEAVGGVEQGGEQGEAD